MIIGIGTDIIEIERIKKACENNKRFIKRIFTENEIHIFGDELQKYETIAVNFAAKETVLKILGTGITGLKWKDIEILREKTGKPVVFLYGSALEKAREVGIDKILISLSHCKDYAVAYGIGVKEMSI